MNLFCTHLQLISKRPPSNSDFLPQRCGSSNTVAPRWPMSATWYCVGLINTWHTSNKGGLMQSRVCRVWQHISCHSETKSNDEILNRMTNQKRHEWKVFDKVVDVKLSIVTDLIFGRIYVSLCVQMTQVCGVKHTFNTIPDEQITIQTERKILVYSFASALGL